MMRFEYDPTYLRELETRLHADGRAADYLLSTTSFAALPLLGISIHIHQPCLLGLRHNIRQTAAVVFSISPLFLVLDFCQRATLVGTTAAQDRTVKGSIIKLTLMTSLFAP